MSRKALEEMRAGGVRLVFVVYDLLPILLPAAFPDFITRTYTEWLETLSVIADGLVCISRTVADELLEWLRRRPMRGSLMQIGYFHLGADLAASVPSEGLEADADLLLAQVRQRPTFLMVGTVEPRKGHAQTLAAFERLWADGVDVGLAIVGGEGWHTESLMARLRAHRRSGRRLYLAGARQ